MDFFIGVTMIAAVLGSIASAVSSNWPAFFAFTALFLSNVARVAERNS